jgi:DedD protein
MSDDAFHEIQLNGKQLIFLCMTAAVVLVVAFLSGVLVGRGVRGQKDAALVAEAAASVAAPVQDPTAPAAVPAVEAAAPPPLETVAPPTPADEELTYEKRLEGKQPEREVLPPVAKAPESAAAKAPAAAVGEPDAPKTAAAPPVKTAPVKTAPAPAVKAAPVAPPPEAPKAVDAAKAKDAAPAGEPPGTGFYLKIVAYRDRPQADAVAKRLSSKGYTSYVVQLGAKGLYSVRVGKYKTRREADATRQRLEKEERFKPLITR